MLKRKPKAKRLNTRLRQLVAKIHRKKKTYPKEFDSGFEHKLSEALDKGWEHHPARLSYVSSHTYQPDFKKEIDGKVIFIEAKGRFRTRNEASKYIAIRECLAEGEELIFIFQNADTPLVGAKRRKDGSRQTHGEWAKINNFRYYCYKEGLPETYE